ncbi:MAG: hypothetical protein MKZ61_05115 [Flavobacteriales bacterium]|nr:hypothetical protein [Flavobacteriales bacterium]
MTRLLQILFACIVIAIITGFMLKSNNPITGDRVIGVTILFTTFIFMPLFIYHRWKDKKLSDYTLTPENFKKMREMGKKSKQSKIIAKG